MKIKQIEVEDDKKIYKIYKVHLVPTGLERLFGKKPVIMRLKETNESYTFGGTNVYRFENGEQTGPHNKIAQELDKFRRKF